MSSIFETIYDFTFDINRRCASVRPCIYTLTAYHLVYFQRPANYIDYRQFIAARGDPLLLDCSSPGIIVSLWKFKRIPEAQPNSRQYSPNSRGCGDRHVGVNYAQLWSPRPDDRDISFGIVLYLIVRRAAVHCCTRTLVRSRMYVHKSACETNFRSDLHGTSWSQWTLSGPCWNPLLRAIR